MVMEIIISVFLLFVGILVLVIIHICIVGRAFRREFFGSDGLPIIIKGSGMTNQDLKKLPCFEYTQNEAKQSTTTATSSVNDCAVCLETFKVGDNCRLLPNCQHYFHVYCVDEWLMKSPFCPICRTCTAFVAAKLSPKVGSSDIVPPDIDIDSNNRHPHQSTTVTNYVVAEESC